MSENEHECGCANAAPGDVIVCRCEEIYLSEIKRALADGAQSLGDLRRLTRAGMGLCQGRICGRLLRGIYAQETGTPIDQVEPATVRSPVRPIPLDVIGKGTEMPEFSDPNDQSGREAPAYTNEIFEAAYGGDGPIVL